jgi:hypothetical protein
MTVMILSTIFVLRSKEAEILIMFADVDHSQKSPITLTPALGRVLASFRRPSNKQFEIEKGYYVIFNHSLQLQKL